MSRVESLARFLWDFVVGDDWRLAAGVVLGLALAAATSTWWILPVVIAVLLAISVWSVARSR